MTSTRLYYCAKRFRTSSTVGCGSRRPQLQWAMVGNAREVPVAAEHRQFMTDAKRGQESIDRSDLYPGTPAAIAQLRRPDVIVAIGYQQRYGGESIQDLFTRSRPQKPCRSSCRTIPVVRIASPLSMARRSACTSIDEGGESRRSAIDQCWFRGRSSIAVALLLIVV